MKYFCSFLTIVSSLIGYAQNDTAHIYQLYSGFSNEEKAEWTNFQNNWYFIQYTNLQKKHHIKALNCKSCESFYADVYLEIDANGKIEVAQNKSLKKCGLSVNDSLLISDFEKSIVGYVFKTFKNKKMIARFGHVLKC